MTGKPIICLTGKVPTKLETALGVISLDKDDLQAAKKLLFGGKEVSKESVVNRIMEIVSLVERTGEKAVLLNCDSYIVSDLEKTLISKGISVCYPYYQEQICIVKENGKYERNVRLVEKAIIKKNKKGISVIQEIKGKKRECTFSCKADIIAKQERKSADAKVLKISVGHISEFDVCRNICHPLIADQCVIREALLLRDAIQATTIPERARSIADIVKDYKADSVLLDLPIYIIRETEDELSRVNKSVMYYQKKRTGLHEIVVKA